MEHYTAALLQNIDENAEPAQQLSGILKARGIWRDVSDSDQEELLTHLQTHIRELSEKLHMREDEIEEAIEARRMKLALRLMHSNPKAAETIRSYNTEYEKALKAENPALYETLMQYRQQSLSHLSQTHPEYAEIIRQFYL